MKLAPLVGVAPRKPVGLLPTALLSTALLPALLATAPLCQTGTPLATVSGRVSDLSVASNGALSGTPGSGDLGTNVFTVQVDATGGSDTTTLNITVRSIKQRPRLTSIRSAH